MTTYKAAIIKQKGGDYELVDLPLQDPSAGQILVKSIACGVCHSDAVVKYELFPGILNDGVRPGRVPGHELIGKVVKVGQGEKRWRVGDIVGGGWHGGHCGQCVPCRSGDFVTCENQAINGITKDGGYAEYALLRSEAVAAVPEGVDPVEYAPILCAGITVFNSLRGMKISAGDIVAVQGLGGLGHLAVQYSRAMGYHTVAISSSDSKKDLATKLGAHIYLNSSKINVAEELQKLGGARVAILTATAGDLINDLVKGLKTDGVVLTLAAGTEIKLNSMDLISKRLRIQGWPSGTAKDSEDAMNFTKLANVKCYTEEFPLEKINEAWDHMMANKARFRAVLKFNE